MVNPNISRRDFLKLAGVTSGGLALTACGLNPTKFPDPTATAAAEVLPTGKPAEFPIPLEVISTTEPIPGHPSVVDGLNIGEVTPNNVVGMIPGYESTGINTLYNPSDLSMLITKQNGEQVEAIPPRAFAIDQEQLINYFGAVDTEGVKVGSYNGTSVTLKNGIWTAATGEAFIPFIKAEPNTDAVYLVMDANGGIQKVDITGKAVGSPMPMFEQPIKIAKRMGFEKADQVVDVEMNKNGSISFTTKEARPTEKDPNRVVQIVSEVAFLGEPVDLTRNEIAIKAVEAFTGALTTVELPMTKDELLNQGFLVLRVQGLDPTDKTKTRKMDFDVATMQIEEKQIGGDYPIMTKDEKGVWKKSTMGNMGRLIGKNIGTNLAAPPYANDFGKETAARLDKLVVAEYNLGILDALGFTWTEWSPGQFDWGKSDAAVALARANGMTIEGDDLIYGTSNQQYTYLNGDFSYNGETINLRKLHTTNTEKVKTILTDIMTNHITQIVKHYKGRVHQWSVVNEIGNAQGNDIYMDIIGPEYVKIAFKAARDADPDAVLMLNEDKSDTMNGKKYELVKQVVEDLKRDKLIDAIGLQMHVDAANPPTKEELIEGLKSWGLPVIVSSLDINVGHVRGSQADKLRAQAELGVMIFQCLGESGVGADYNMWAGFGDKFSWPESPGGGNQKDADPTPFTDDGKPKLWVFAIEKEILEELQGE